MATFRNSKGRDQDSEINKDGRRNIIYRRCRLKIRRVSASAIESEISRPNLISVLASNQESQRLRKIKQRASNAAATAGFSARVTLFRAKQLKISPWTARVSASFSTFAFVHLACSKPTKKKKETREKKDFVSKGTWLPTGVSAKWKSSKKGTKKQKREKKWRRERERETGRGEGAGKKKIVCSAKS